MSHSSTRSAWLQIQSDCPDLWRVHAHLKQGTRPTNVCDVKHSLNCTSIAKDGVLMVKHSQSFVPLIEAIVVPWSVLDGLLTAPHIKLNHPSCHQFQMVLQHQFFALDMNNAISHVTSACRGHNRPHPLIREYKYVEWRSWGPIGCSRHDPSVCGYALLLSNSSPNYGLNSQADQVC